MTGFDETVPPDAPQPDDERPVGADRDESAVPEHDEAVPALEDAPEPDEPAT